MTGAKYDPAALRDIIGQLEKASGPDYEIDCLIADATGFDDQGLTRDVLGEPFGKTALWKTERALPGWTSSLDACVALADRVLPGCVWNLVTDFGDYAGASVSTDDKTPIYTERRQGATLALAFLLAIFNALLAQNTDQPDG